MKQVGIDLTWSPEHANSSLSQERIWESWKEACLQTVQQTDLAEIRPPSSPDTYDGTYVVKLSDTRIYWVNATDFGWDCDVSGELNSDGTIAREPEGSDLILTEVVDLLAPIHEVLQDEDYFNELNIHGAVYALAQVLQLRKSGQPTDQYWNFAAHTIQEIIGIER